MQKVFNKIFDNKILFLAAPLVYLIAYLVSDSYYETVSNNFEGYYYIISDILYFVIMIGIVISFVNHEKNVMKGLVGALLFDYLSCSASYAAYYSVMDSSDVPYSIFAILVGVFAIVLFVNHFRLAADHKAKPITVYINQITILLLMALEIAWEVYDLVAYEGSGAEILYAAGYCLSRIAILYLICAVETKIDFFKTVRQEKLSEEQKETVQETVAE